MHIPLSTTLFILLCPIFARAANDWSTRCSGSCAYETGDGTTTAWGTILIDGAPEAISDISTAAGWSIMDCDSSSREEQVIRLVCHDPDAGCEQLFEGGAVDTIVRLSEECADAPFARVVNITTSSNQTLSTDVAERVATRKRSTPPEVLTVTIDYNFQLLPASRGTVSLTALATTNPLQRPLATAQRLRRALGYGSDGALNARSGNSANELVAREIRRRDLFADFIGGNQIPPGTTASALRNGVSATDGMRVSQRWSHDWNHQFNVLNIQQSFPVVDVDLNCPQSGDIPAFGAKLKIDADVNVQATVTVGFIIAGTIIPPAITKAAFTSALDGGAQVSFNVNAVAQGSFNTGLLPFYSSGMAGMSIPGILDVGPTFSINGQGIGSISVCTDAVVKANYQFPGLSMVYPQSEGPSSGQASQGDDQSPLTLSIGGSASLTGSVSAHVIPRVDLGVSVLSGMASASVFLELDGYGSLDMSLSLDEATTTIVAPNTTSSIAADEVTTSTTSPERVDQSTSATSTTMSDATLTADAPSTSDAPTSPPALEAAITPASDAPSSLDIAPIPVANELALPPDVDDPVMTPVSDATPTPTTCARSRPRRRRQQRQRRDLATHSARDASTTYSGCVGVQMGVRIAAGAQGKLLSFWHDSTTFDLFSHEWELLNKCFKTTTKRSLPFRHGPVIPSSRPLPSLPRRDIMDSLICPVIDHAINDALTASNEIV